MCEPAARRIRTCALLWRRLVAVIIVPPPPLTPTGQVCDNISSLSTAFRAECHSKFAYTANHRLTRRDCLLNE